MTKIDTTTEAAKIAQEIRAGLEGVTPGPWTVIRSHPNDGWNGWYLRSTGVEEDIGGLRGGYPPHEHQQDAAHLANCSPDRIAILLNAFDAQVEEIERLRALADEHNELIHDLSERAYDAEGEAARWRALVTSFGPEVDISSPDAEHAIIVKINVVGCEVYINDELDFKATLERALDDEIKRIAARDDSTCNRSGTKSLPAASTSSPSTEGKTDSAPPMQDAAFSRWFQHVAQLVRDGFVAEAESLVFTNEVLVREKRDATIAAQSAALALAREALKPFGKLGTFWPNEVGTFELTVISRNDALDGVVEDESAWAKADFLVDDLRRARSALRTIDSEERP